jgi:hypothetical protein
MGVYSVERRLDQDGAEMWWIGGHPVSHQIQSREAIDKLLAEHGADAPRELLFPDEHLRVAFVAEFGE